MVLEVPWMITVFLINLASSPDRLASVTQAAEACGLNFERFEALYGAKIRHLNHLENAFDQSLSDGEVGCYASHLSCHNLLLERGLEQALILEDDIEFHKDFLDILNQAVLMAPKGWDIIHLSTIHKRAIWPLIELGTEDFNLVQYSRLPVNTAAYLISRSGAEKFLNPRLRIRPVDMDIRYGWLRDLNIYGVFPAPVRQRPEMISTIGEIAPRRFELGKGKTRKLSPGLWSELHGLKWMIKKTGLRPIFFMGLQNFFRKGSVFRSRQKTHKS
jgi:glycosyl transferase, family 25